MLANIYLAIRALKPPIALSALTSLIERIPGQFARRLQMDGIPLHIGWTNSGPWLRGLLTCVEMG